jgi:drug/metabolite transporter (DMT)-like permease
MGRALLAALLFGAATPLAKHLLGALGPVTLAGLLYLGGALATAPAALRASRGPPTTAHARRRDARMLAAAVVFGGIAAPVLMLLGLRIAGAAEVSLLLPLETVFTALLGAALFRDHLGRWGIAGVAAGLSANLVIAGGGGLPRAAAAALIAAACLCWALDNHWTARIETLRPAASTFWKCATAGAFNLLSGLLLDPAFPVLSAVALALACGALAYGVSVFLYVSAAREIGATRAQALFAASPLAGVAIAVVWLGEPFALRFVPAAALLVISLWCIGRSRHSHAHAHAEKFHEHEHRHDDGHHEHEHPGQPTSLRHSHAHRHARLVHAHPHWPDVHHRHAHDARRQDADGSCTGL